MKLTEWKRLWIQNTIYRQTLTDVLTMSWSESEIEICKKKLTEMMDTNFDMMDMIESVVTKYKFRINELYCLN